mgnify:CR=1 FL=1
MTVAVLSALRKESSVFFDMEGDPVISEFGIDYAIRNLEGARIVAACGGMGTINAASATQFLVDRFSPDALVFSGIAGSLNPRIGTGDVVVGERLECLDSDMGIIAESTPHLTSFPSDGHLVHLAEQELFSRSFVRVASIREGGDEGHAAAYGTLESHAPRYTTGTVATSDLFSTDPATLASIRKDYLADCEEMEGVAAAQVCARAGVPFLAIRSMSNVCGEAYEELDNKADDLVSTARLAAEVTLGIVRRFVRGE